MLNSMKGFLLTACLIVSFFVVQYAVADDLVMKNGDRITGTITAMAGDTLIIETSYSPPIKIEKSKILRIATTKAVEVHLSSGEVLKGNMRTDEEGALSVESSEERRKNVIQWNAVSSIYWILGVQYLFQ